MKSSVTVSMILNEKTSPIWSVSPESTVFEAIQMMAEKNIGALLVMADQRLHGVISERDYTRKVALKGRSSSTTKVREILSPSVVSVTPAHTVDDCMRLMTANRIRHLPVLQGDVVIGIISIGDLVNWTISAQDAAIQQLESYITGL
jgi:CBS domain-containing protein